MKEKPKYNTLQNVGFMLGMARQVDKSVPFLCAGIAAATAGGTIAQLLLAPAVLARVESRAPLQSLVGVILAFTAVLFVLYGVKAYLDENAIYGRISVRLQIISHISDKMAGTSFSNALDTGFVKAIEKSASACLSNQDATEAVWQTLTDLLTNLLASAPIWFSCRGCIPFCWRWWPSPRWRGIWSACAPTAGSISTGRKRRSTATGWAICAAAAPTGPTPRTSACSGCSPG